MMNLEIVKIFRCLQQVARLVTHSIIDKYIEACIFSWMTSVKKKLPS